MAAYTHDLVDPDDVSDGRSCTHGYYDDIVNTYYSNWSSSYGHMMQQTLLSQNGYTYDAVGNRTSNTITIGQAQPRTENYGDSTHPAMTSLTGLYTSIMGTAMPNHTRSMTWTTAWALTA